ncbi:MAG: hypothetical protein A2139_06830 [Desulfobacca sp. RBG_16_60_12]|nr:MAG: hypothetical protein A2139_06830 [Desulfobacca sp. RBG_16_60_12]
MGGFVPGSNATIENSLGRLHVGGVSVVGSGNTLTVTWRVNFKSGFSSKNLYLRAINASGQNTGFVDRGDWSVTP